MPTTVQVNGRSLKVKLKSARKMEGLAGSFYSPHGSIEISKNQDAYEAKDTLLHEVFHALLHTQGREYGGEVEEVYVRALATGFVGMLKGDPAFIAWLVSTPQEVSHE
jgi:hypothetical protein